MWIRLWRQFMKRSTSDRRAIDEGVEKYLVGGPTQPVFRRYNR